MKSPAIVRETIALKATDEPILMRQISAVNVAQKATALSGRLEFLLTLDKKLEKGRPLSREKAQVWREAEARKPKEAQITSAIRMEVMTEAPTKELVAL